MSRLLRLQFAGAVYHVTSRGQRRQAIYLDDTDRFVWLDILARICARFAFSVHGFCLMGNHYHVLIETSEPNLSDGMRQLNAQYSQYFNRRHEVVGHLFQGRYTAVLVQKDNHLRELARYVVLNPVRAGMVATVDGWPWSSYAYMIQERQSPAWLQTRWMLEVFADSQQQAIDAYKRFVGAGIGMDSPLKQLRHQLLLGDDAFVARHRQPRPEAALAEVKKEHRRALALSLDEYRASSADRDSAITAAYHSTAYTMTQLASYFGVSKSTISRIIRRVEAELQSSSCAIGRIDPGYKKAARGRLGGGGGG
ncbi:addiction module toxin RelE [Duganella sp. FT80W]|uniref:Addiction module toxin RelE n=1 Tax=Duganella guangzhouensis TaxID=2666084 RepID=A0A6I2L281_9BURK|nr:transposase [Duganella guangzhouensis]MRW91912.1 addiction module toxin RelE [Duganella guangzhouensis]